MRRKRETSVHNHMTMVDQMYFGMVMCAIMAYFLEKVKNFIDWLIALILGEEKVFEKGSCTIIEYGKTMSKIHCLMEEENSYKT